MGHWNALANTFRIEQQGSVAVIPVFDNPTYTMNMCQQLRGIGVDKIVILDNKSATRKMHDVLTDQERRGCTVLRLPDNFGPHFLLRHEKLWDLLPKTFVLTDPDLRLNPEFPENALEVMAKVSDVFSVGKVGVALDISQPDSLSESPIIIGERTWSPLEWEMQFWRFPLINSLSLQLYAAPVDTTFALYNRDFFRREFMFEGIRVAGNFTAIHLPWLKIATVPSEELRHYRMHSKFSNWFPPLS